MEFILETANYTNYHIILTDYPQLVSFNICSNDTGNCVIFIDSFEEFIKLRDAVQNDLIVRYQSNSRRRYTEKGLPTITIYDDYVE